MAIDADWDKPQEQTVAERVIANSIGAKPAFMSDTRTKLLYDDENFIKTDWLIYQRVKSEEGTACGFVL